MTANETGATTESAAETVAAVCDDRELVVVSNRQPYSHHREETGTEAESEFGTESRSEIGVDRPAGGLTAALDPVMQAVEGTWVAWGDGDADRQVVGPDDSVAVPPEEPSYDLRRVWLSPEQVEGYYRGYSNQVLWPACHLDTAKINAREEYWQAYRETNGDFADAVLDATGGASDSAGGGASDANSPVVWFQDYHLALAPRIVREERPEAFLAQFWHVPWPSWDVLRAVPQYEELLDGLLANDLVGFHTDEYCRNFLDCVEFGTRARVDRGSKSISYKGGRTFVRSFPLGIDAQRQAELAESDVADEWWADFRETYDLAPDTALAVGVERLDYTKGIEERLAALERFWETRPEWRGDLTYVQKGTESRSGIDAYDQLQERVADGIEHINDRFATDDWTPIVSLTDHVPEAGLSALYREADLALVTPVRDGMNLVAKEYVAGQTRDPGLLVLSELAGASEQLGDGATLVHPRDANGVADAIEESLSLPRDERRRRIATLQRAVHAEDVYAWLESTFETAAAIERGRRSSRTESGNRVQPTDD